MTIDPQFEHHYDRIQGHILDLVDMLPPIDRASINIQLLIVCLNQINDMVIFARSLQEVRDE